MYGGNSTIFVGDDPSEALVHRSPLRNIALRNYDRRNIGCNRSTISESNRSRDPSHNQRQRKA
ncbi:MAG: hypothetical protein ACKO0N_12895, partial [Planctomycetota bacterium]